MPEGARGFLDVIPALRNRECIVCGEGVAIPIRVALDTLEPERRPASRTRSSPSCGRDSGGEEEILQRVIARWRSQGREGGPIAAMPCRLRRYPACHDSTAGKRMIGIEDVRAASRRIAGKVVRTPAIHSDAISRLTGADVWLKLDTLQVTGAFKERGAANRLALLTPEERAAGVVAMSAGNHAQAVRAPCRAASVFAR